MAEEEEIPDVFRFDSVSVWQYPDAQEEGETSYEAETENMDGVICVSYAPIRLLHLENLSITLQDQIFGEQNMQLFSKKLYV